MPSDVQNGQETALRLNPESGFLESGRYDRLSTDLKLQIIEKYRQTGNLCDSSVAVGAPYATVRWYQENDPAFKGLIDQVHKEFVERAKGYMLTHMARPGNYMDRVTIARRFEPGVWGDQVKHSLDVNVTHVTEALKKAESIEAELEAPPSQQPEVKLTESSNKSTE